MIRNPTPIRFFCDLLRGNPVLRALNARFALEAVDDSSAELDRIAELADLDEDEIITTIGITKSNWDNAKKVLPKFAEQLGDVIRDGDSFTIADAPGRADAGPAPQRRAPAAVRAPRTSRAVTPQNIGRAATAEDFDEFASRGEVDQAAAAAGIRNRRLRLRRHNFLVQKLAARLAKQVGNCSRTPSICLRLFATLACW